MKCSYKTRQETYLFRSELSSPGLHSLIRISIFYGMENVIQRSFVQPIVISEIWARTPLAPFAMTGKTLCLEYLLCRSQSVSICHRNIVLVYFIFIICLIYFLFYFGIFHFSCIFFSG